MTYTLQVTALRVEDGQVSFDFDGVLPPVVYLSITSEEASVLFTDDGTCTIEAAGTRAVCELDGAQTLLDPLARIVAAVNDDFVADATVGITTPDEDTTVTVAMAATSGGAPLDTETFTVQGSSTEPEPDVGLTGFPSAVEPTNVHEYVVTGTLTKSAYDGGVAFDIGGDDRARFADVVPDACTRTSDTRIECEALAAGSVTLPLYVQDNSTDTSITLTVSPSDGPDSDATNDSVTVVLERFVPETSVRAQIVELRGNSGKALIESVVSAEDSSLSMVLTGDFDPRFLDADPPAGCTRGEVSVTCEVIGNATLQFAVDVTRVPRATTEETFTFRVTVPGDPADVVDLDDTASVVVQRAVASTGTGAGDAGTTVQSTSNGLAPSGPSSLAVDTIEEAAKASKATTASRTTRATEPARVKVARTRSGSGAERRDVVPDRRADRSASGVKDAAAGARPDRDDSPVDTVTQAVKKIL